MNRWKIRLAAGVALIAWATGAAASLIPITSYNVDNTPESGYGGTWANTYNGTITPTGVSILSFDFFAGTIANYSGGTSGTLNDGVIGTSASDTQLFVSGGPILSATDPSPPNPLTTSDSNPVNPAITLFLGGGFFTIDSIYLYEGNFTNGIPGALTGAIVNLCNNNNIATCDGSIGGISATLATSDANFPNVDAVFSTAAATGIQGPLSTFPTQFIVLSDFAGLNSQQWFSISEIQVFGSPVETNSTPEPGSFALLGVALGALALARRRFAHIG